MEKTFRVYDGQISKIRPADMFVRVLNKTFGILKGERDY